MELLNDGIKSAVEMMIVINTSESYLIDLIYIVVSVKLADLIRLNESKSTESRLS